jgi:hypothetical protein
MEVTISVSSRCPIVITSFNRSEYLSAVLRSLADQQNAALGERQIVLFQDGAVNPFSGKVYYEPGVESENIRVFQHLFPNGIVMASNLNLGIALNFDRAERYVFGDLDADAAIFLEDDLVLGPHYIAVLERMIALALENESIGYVAAYGIHTATMAQQLTHRSALVNMSHNWAFGLTRRQWLRQKFFVDQYIAIVRDTDYRRRDHDRIIDLFHSWDLGVPGTSQDIAKTHACILTNAAKVNTYACFGRYIGESGVHSTPEFFERMGYRNTNVMTEDVPNFATPSNEVLDKFVATARQAAMVEAVKKRAAG